MLDEFLALDCIDDMPLPETECQRRWQRRLLNPRDQDRNTPLIVSAGCSPEAARALLRFRRVKPSAANDFGDTAAHEAARHGNLRVLACLAARGANLNAVNWRGATPLLCSPDGRFTDLLIENGADPSAVDLDGNSGVHKLAEMSVCKSVLQRAFSDPRARPLLNSFNKVSLPHVSFSEMRHRRPISWTESHPRRAALCLAQDGRAPLHVAVTAGNLLAAAELVAAGADPDLLTCDDRRETALHSAVRAEDAADPQGEGSVCVSMVKGLLSVGARIDIFDGSEVFWHHRTALSITGQ